MDIEKETKENYEKGAKWHIEKSQNYHITKFIDKFVKELKI